VVCLFSQLVQALLEEESFLFEFGLIPVRINVDRFSPDENPLEKG